MNTYITGIGIYSSLGSNTQEVASALLNNKCSIAPHEDLILAGFQSPQCAKVPEPSDSDLPKLHRHRALLTQAGRYAYVAALEALKMAGQEDLLSGYAERNIGLIVSNDITAQSVGEVKSKMEKYNDTDSLDSRDAFRTLNSNIAIALSSIFGFRSLTFTLGAACAGGLHAIGIADNLVRQGLLDGCLVVGAQETGAISWCAFDKLQTGVEPSGGAAAVFIDNEIGFRESPKVKLAKIIGYGFSTGRSPITPSSDAELKAIEMANEKVVGHIDLINAHLTGTEIGDRAEFDAMNAAFPDGGPEIWATKLQHGHELAMSGVSQVVETILVQKNKTIQINAFGFGGNNASLVIQTI